VALAGDWESDCGLQAGQHSTMEKGPVTIVHWLILLVGNKKGSLWNSITTITSWNQWESSQPWFNLKWLSVCVWRECNLKMLLMHCVGEFRNYNDSVLCVCILSTKHSIRWYVIIALQLEMWVENFVFESFKNYMKLRKIFKTTFHEIFIKITNCFFRKL